MKLDRAPYNSISMMQDAAVTMTLSAASVPEQWNTFTYSSGPTSISFIKDASWMRKVSREVRHDIEWGSEPILETAKIRFPGAVSIISSIAVLNCLHVYKVGTVYVEDPTLEI